MTFRLEHHNKILTILESLDSDLLKESSAYFGGGTLIALDFGEYRQSKDVDLAALRLQFPIPENAVDKAEHAYETLRPLKVAVQRFQERSSFREKCFSGLQIDDAQIPKLMDGIDLLAGDLDLAVTGRVFKEQHDMFSD